MSNEKKQEGWPDWFNMNLSELVDKSMALGVIPLFSFLDKNKVRTVSIEPPMSAGEETPVYILKKQIEHYRRIIHMIQTKEGLTLTAPDAEEKLRTLEQKMHTKVVEFSAAIDKLNHS